MIKLCSSPILKDNVVIDKKVSALSLCPDKSDDYQLFKAVIRLARHAGVSPYNADKAVWLIGSGNFYADPHMGNMGRVGRRKREFIEYAKPLLEKKKITPNYLMELIPYSHGS